MRRLKPEEIEQLKTELYQREAERQGALQRLADLAKARAGVRKDLARLDELIGLVVADLEAGEVAEEQGKLPI